MYVLFVKTHVKPERKEEFLRATFEDGKGSLQNEVGCLQFDVIEDVNDQNTIYLYEVYKDKAANEHHRTTPHFIKWRDAVRETYVEPMEILYGTDLFPPSTSRKKQSV